MEQARLNKRIERAGLNRSTSLYLRYERIAFLPESIGDLVNLTHLYLDGNQLTNLPESIVNLVNLTHLDLRKNQLTSLPESIGNLSNLNWINLTENPLIDLSILKNARDVSIIEMGIWFFLIVIFCIIDIAFYVFYCVFIKIIFDFYRKITGKLPLDVDIIETMRHNLSFLKYIYKYDSKTVRFFNIELPRKYLTKLSEWKSEWLLDENNAEIRRALIAQVGYEKICRELNAVPVNTWREYTLLKIDGVKRVYANIDEPIDLEPMVLLKMTCLSTQHIHILRVPPEMTSAEKAITWVNHGIHPDKFAVQT